MQPPIRAGVLHGHCLDGIEQYVGRVVRVGIIELGGLLAVFRFISGDKGVISRAFWYAGYHQVQPYASLANNFNEAVLVQPLSTHKRDVLQAFHFPGV